MNGLQRILILKYNNYFNKLIKKEDNIDRYLLYGFEYDREINFNSNDGVDAVQILTLTKDQAKSDYMVVLKEGSDLIESRWFIIETVRQNGNQYRCTLRRDVIADYMDEVKTSLAFIERGYINPDGSNPLIYNHENLKFNKIKKGEFLITNEIETPWIIIYLSRSNNEGKGLDYHIEFDWEDINFQQRKIYKNICDFKYYSDTSTRVVEPYTKDAEYEIIAIPYTDKQVSYNIIEDGVRRPETAFPDKEIILQWAAQIGAKYNQAGYVYDIQLMPYCPIQGIKGQTTIDFTGSVGPGGKQLKPIELLELINPDDLTYKKRAVGFKVWTKSIDQFFRAKGMDQDPQIFQNFNQIKESNELDLFRITSPNGVGNYDYSPAKNKFFLFDTFNIDATLKPINPYLKISPVFDNNNLNPDSLYGKDYNDYRGLICSGNFSLSLLNNTWLTYELNNKNYQTMFNREVDTLDTSNDMNRVRDIVSATSGALTGAAAGALAGSIFGPVGTAVGAAIGGIASAGGGTADVLMNEREREINRELKIDTFNMSHENVKARSVGLTRSTIFNKNNKIFPYIEYFTCTPEEKEHFETMMNLRCYNIGVVDHIEDYLKPVGITYIKGSIIYINIKEDYHLVKTINDYVEGGFRIDV